MLCVRVIPCLDCRDGRVVNAVSEFEDCVRLAAANNLSVKDVQALAVQAYAGR